MSQLLHRFIGDYSGRETLATRARARRFVRFIDLIADLPEPVRILDLGGTARFWQLMPATGKGLDLTIANLDQATMDAGDMRVIEADARSLDFADNEFDVVFSNSLIEHVGDKADQMAMAREVRRLAPRYFVQTPSLWFPLEPHFLFPGFQFLPFSTRAWLLQRFRLGHVGRIDDPVEADRWVRSIRLLGAREFMAMFPDAQLLRERFLGLTKSFMAIRS
jgi:hypothetical protein